MFKSHTVYKAISSVELRRYMVVEHLPRGVFYVLHADVLRLNDHSNDKFLANLTIERLLELNPGEVSWAESLEEAIQMDDAEFES